ncbi:MAG: peptidylprolyl isomerase [Cyclobacteriaceae bacterium]|nr:peptidylprolyl isomerase [Cyclobacteriaceae bacterium]
MMRSVVALLLCCLVFDQLTAQSGKTRPNAEAKAITVFSVNKKPVSADEFIYLYRKNHQHKPEDFTPEKVQEYLDLFINFKLKVEEAKKRGLDTTKAFHKEFNSYKEELRKPYLPDHALSDSLTRLTYERLKEEIRASHILINLKPDATPQDTARAYARIMEVRSKALDGQDFGSLAMQYSEDPSAKMNKGDLGYFTALQMVYPFENAAYETKVGRVSTPIRTRFGYHLVKVEDRKPSRGEVEVAHIMIRTGEASNEEKARNTIFEIHDQLRGGVKWDELCKQYSEDPGSKDNGGRLRPFGVGAMASIPAFEQVAFSLQEPGEISDPFQSQYGWHIMRLENKIPLASYDDMASSLKARVNRDERTQISRQALQTKLRKEFNLTESTEIKSKVMLLADSTLITGKWKVPSNPVLEREWLVSIAEKKVLVRDFIKYVQQQQRPATMVPEKYMDQLYSQFIDVKIAEALEERILTQHPDYGMLLKEYYEGILLFDIMEKEVWNRASEDSVGQWKYFQANTSRYQAGERLQGILYSSASADLIVQLHELLETGSDSVTTENFIKTNKIREERGSYEKEEKPILSKIPWSVGLHSAENNGMYYLARITAMRQPGPKSFKEARPGLISDYQTYLETNWLASLRKKYPVKVNEKGKKYVLGQLQQP